MKLIYSDAKRRLRGNGGESLAETLVALLVGSLSLMLLAGMIAASAHVIAQSKSQLKAYNEADNRLVEQTAADDTPTGTVTTSVKLTDAGGAIAVDYFVNGEVASYRKHSASGAPQSGEPDEPNEPNEPDEPKEPDEP